MRILPSDQLVRFALRYGMITQKTSLHLILIKYDQVHCFSKCQNQWKETLIYLQKKQGPAKINL